MILPDVLQCSSFVLTSIAQHARGEGIGTGTPASYLILREVKSTWYFSFSSLPRMIAPTASQSATVRLYTRARCALTRCKTAWRLAFATRAAAEIGEQVVVDVRYSVISSFAPFPAGRFVFPGEYKSVWSQAIGGRATL